MNQWNDIEEDMQNRLIEWYNICPEDIDEEDRERLAELYFNHNFSSWNCPECGEHVHFANPDDWEHFQGTCNADYTSYPGMCDNCRMTK